jgi:hypothetical protein
MRTLPRLAALALALVAPALAGACAGDAVPLDGRWRASDPSGGFVTLDFRSATRVHMALGADAERPTFGRELDYSKSGDTVTIVANPGEGKPLVLTLDGDELEADGLVFERL